jgi:hypothetical protein
MNAESIKPVAVVVGFNLLTLLVFVTAPVTWVTAHLTDLCLLVVCSQLMIVLGYQLGQRSGSARPTDPRLPFVRGRRLMNLLFAVYVLTFLLIYAYRTDFSPLDVRAMANRLILGLQDPRWSYFGSLQNSATGGPVRWSVFFAVSVFNQLFFVAGFLYWRRLGRGRKLVFALLASLELLYWVATATAFGVVSMMTTLGLSSLFSLRTGPRNLRRSATNALLLLILLAVSIAFFSYNLYRRNDFKEIDITQFDIVGMPVYGDAPTLVLVPQPLHQAYIKVVLYMGQGYYHACLALGHEFRWTKFLGSNGALVALAERLGVDVWSDTYMHRLQRDGISEYAVWHSAYTWWAGDVTFYGVPLLLFGLGWLFGFSWALGTQGDFLSQIFFVLFGNMLLYLFANNTYLASVFYAMMLFAPIWFLTRVVPIWLIAPTPRRRVSARPAPRVGRLLDPVESHGDRAET